MILILRVIYIILIGFAMYQMFKRGGCCGGHMNHSNNDERINVDKNKNIKPLISEEERKNAIDL
ncbi:hypothetical protein [Tepidibacter formicigenes]|jgi:hypothetical protein|uniref:Uncharacterized protein n=1 Tax=Tepidibacter formicigenes DSM 15518 TaxID=1123349 RepID=A0A1M6LLE1_9FIRM|nr:hypothetical protein [Tepidibacter formicigenes]SHJ71994.1 hypothetical protein SAMN02744037_00679 [Tepidibacter formicigenes DSM 15518]